MYREALHLSPDGETVGVEAFVAVARKHGLAAWQMNYGARWAPVSCATCVFWRCEPPFTPCFSRRHQRPPLLRFRHSPDCFVLKGIRQTRWNF